MPNGQYQNIPKRSQVRSIRYHVQSSINVTLVTYREVQISSKQKKKAANI